MVVHLDLLTPKMLSPHDTIPFMNTMERMNNPYFQEKPFFKFMKGKQVTNDFDKLDHESFGHDTDSDKEGENIKASQSVLSTALTCDHMCENVDVNSSGPELSLLPQPRQPKSRGQVIDSGRILRRRGEQPKRSRKNPDWFTSTRDGFAPKNEYSPTVLQYSILFPIRITREK